VSSKIDMDYLGEWNLRISHPHTKLGAN
jgi:hypothetical protein